MPLYLLKSTYALVLLETANLSRENFKDDIATVEGAE
ncbi:Protein of unknown function [Bacillus cytotoxicus]|nr:Protein of unknown function [Bacillus cytotoxicus]